MRKKTVGSGLNPLSNPSLSLIASYLYNRAMCRLSCDLYSLTMVQGYWKNSHNPQVVFDTFFRLAPFEGGFTIFAGLASFFEELAAFRFQDEDLRYLHSLGLFQKDFLDYLQHFSFKGDIYSVKEGEVIFPREPIMRIHGTLIETQLIEALLLNTINFQTLIATKCARMYIASQGGTLVEFGLRRAQGLDGALSASRACYIGGASATSHVEAGRQYGIPLQGTMAHSWIMAFANEQQAFERYAALYPDRSTFLLDTYDSLGSGIEAAIAVGKRLQQSGKRIGVRLDSGDIQYLSMRVRERLDQAGLTDARIVVSNELDEMIIHQLVSSQAPIDVWGVGTKMVTGSPDAALSGVYKLAAKEQNGTFVPVMKFSDNPEKSSNPGVKQIYRYYSREGVPAADLIALTQERVTQEEPRIFYHPSLDYRHFFYKPQGEIRQLLTCYMRQGQLAVELPSLEHIRATTLHNLAHFDDSYLRIINPHIYKVSITEALRKCKKQLVPSTKRIGS